MIFNDIELYVADWHIDAFQGFRPGKGDHSAAEEGSGRDSSNGTSSATGGGESCLYHG